MDHQKLLEIQSHLDERDDWCHLDELAGTSPEICDFVASISDVPAQFAPDVIEVIWVDRPCGLERVDSFLVRQLGFGNALRFDLCPGAPSFNAEVLFGSSRREGCFDSGTNELVLVDLAFIDSAAVARLNRIIATLPAFGLQRLCIVTEMNEIASAFEDRLTEVARVRKFRMPRLSERSVDIPYEVHLAARHVGSGLDQFSICGLTALCSNGLAGDVAELDHIVQHLVRRNAQDVVLDETLVRKQVADSQVKFRAAEYPPCDVLWAELRAKRDQIDQLCTALIQTPFFVSDSAVVSQSPVGSPSPEFDFFRLVSWAYVTLQEQAKPNLDAVLRLMTGLKVSPSPIVEVRLQVGRLRTYLQHSLQYGSESDQATMQVVFSWFEKAIGKRQPQRQDFEACSRSLLFQQIQVFDQILKFLDRLNRDTLRELPIRQWLAYRETTWPKHSFQVIVNEALRNLDRSDLDEIIVCEAILAELQERLRATKQTENREHILVSRSEILIQERYPVTPPINGSDLIDLGVLPGRELGELLKEIRDRFEETQATKEELLSEFAEVISNAKQVRE